MSHSPQILLVEDNPNDAELSIRALKKNNFVQYLVHVKDGQEALDFLFGTGAYAGRDINDQPKVVLLDLKLPKVNGLQVLRQIRANPNTKLMPVVVLTSSREDRDLIDAYNLGVNSYIVKPVDYEKFTEAVTHLGTYWTQLNEIPMES